MNSILLITQEYPINRGDSCFIVNEIPYLSGKFDKIHVLCLSNKEKDDELLDVPDNVSVYFISNNYRKLYNYIHFFRIIFMSVFYCEILWLIKNKKFSFRGLKYAISYVYRAIILKKHTKYILKKDNDINIIYTFWYLHETLSALLLKRKFKNVNYITRAHGYDIHEFQRDLNYQPYKFWMDKEIDKIFFASQYLRNYYIDKFSGCDHEKYITMPLGIINNYSSSVIKNEKTGIFTLCSCSYIIPRKRVHLIVKALEQINDFSIHWIHIGDGSDMNNIMSLCNDLLKNKKNITYEFKGFMTNGQIMRFYNEKYIDCFISATEAEGGRPVSIMEAISFGIPVIATGVGGVPEIVNKDTGFLLNPEGDIAEIGSTITGFYNLAETEKNALRLSARLFWENNFNAEKNYETFSDILLSISSNNNGNYT